VEFDWNAYAAWYEAENFKEAQRIYNGSGQLIYRGSVMGYAQPIASIRLKPSGAGTGTSVLLVDGAKERPEWRMHWWTASSISAPFGSQAMLDTEIWKNDPGSGTARATPLSSWRGRR
jgi:hypothetical protein